MLNDEIETSQRLVRTDAYQMSIGEIVSMYKEKELIINPDFQRLFRWESGQKSKLIESILLGIPLPPIFVFEREDSKWELIDGLQRVSTILEFMGVLVNPEGDLRPPSVLEATKYLPSLSNVVWDASDLIADLPLASQQPLDKPYQLTVRRARLGVEILKKPSDNNTKFDLFQRLNSAGTQANAQELRNCIVIMVSPEYFDFVKGLTNNAYFQSVMAINDDQIEKQKNFEYVCRFLTHVFVPYDGKLDVEEFIDTGITSLAAANDTASAMHSFESTFRMLSELHGSDSLRRYENGSHTGRIGLAAFEVIAVGIGRNISAIELLPNPMEFIEAKIKDFWLSPGIDRFFTPGLRGTIRIQRTVTFGDAWFKP